MASNIEEVTWENQHLRTFLFFLDDWLNAHYNIWCDPDLDIIVDVLNFNFMSPTVVFRNEDVEREIKLFRYVFKNKVTWFNI